MWLCLLTSLLLAGDLILVKSSVSEKPLEEKHSRQDESEGDLKCPVTLPQKSTKNCRSLRRKELQLQQGIFQLVSKPPFPTPMLNMTVPGLMAHYLSRDTFGKEHFFTYLGMLKKNSEFGQQWMTEHPEEITEFQGYEDMFHEFRSKLASNGSSDLFRIASNTEPFRDILENWRDDAMFAEQRLSGVDPQALRRVTDDSSEVGLKWSELSKTLNPNYNWEAAIQAATNNNEPLEKVIKNGKLYVLRYELFDDMVSFPEVVDHNPGRTLWPSKSPVALFAIRSKKRRKHLRPVAIQLDYKPDSPVFSPVDGGSWMLAKMVVQGIDFAQNQIVEHLVKIHSFSEPFCVVLYRQLSSQHPLNELLKYHCRGLITANLIGGPQLVIPDGSMDRLTAMGHKGTILLMARASKTLTWKNADHRFDIKKRGLNNKKFLPYFPYRDDCELMLKTIRKMAKDYVNIYYRKNRHVKQDKELQAYVHEVSVEGSGQVKDFPAVLTTKRDLIDMVTKLLWLLSVKHATVNFPVSDYGAFTPMTPTKVFNDTRVQPGEFSIFNLPNGNISSTQLSLAVNVGTFHYDTLFDYYEQLSNPEASKVVRDSYNHLKDVISPKLKRRNERRFRDGHLTYPYLQHSWIPNGVST